MADTGTDDGSRPRPSAFKLQNAIQAGSLDSNSSTEQAAVLNLLTNDSSQLLSSVQGTDSLTTILEQQQHALTSL